MVEIGHQPPSKRAFNTLFAPLVLRLSLPPLCNSTITKGQHAHAQQQEPIQTYYRAYGACMEGHGYTIK